MPDSPRTSPGRLLTHPHLTVDIEGLPILVQQFISIDTIYRPPVEWTDGMPNVNRRSTSVEVRWILRDEPTGTENAEIDWHFRLGEHLDAGMTGSSTLGSLAGAQSR